MFTRIFCLYLGMVILFGLGMDRASASTLQVNSPQEEAVSTHKESGALSPSVGEMASRDWHNLGVDALKGGDVAKGILSLERAMLTEPSNKTIREALGVAYRSSVGVQSALADVPSSPLDGLCYLLSIPLWIGLALVCFALSLGCFVAYRFVPSVGSQKIFFSASLVFFGFCLFCNACVAHQLYYHQQRESRLIVTTATPVYSSPMAEEEATLQILPVGVPLALEEVDGVWCRVRLSSIPTSVWIPKSFVEPVFLSALESSAQ